MQNVELGVVIVTYNSGSEAADCAESLLAAAAAADVPLQVVVVDNASPDGTASLFRRWASGTEPYVQPDDNPFPIAPVPKPVALAEGGPDLAADKSAGAPRVALIESGGNLGFAGGVNIGLAYLAQFPSIQHFWLLNPDCVVPPESMARLKEWMAEAGRYGVMGSRVTYLHNPDEIQMDGGRVNRRNGVTSNINLGQPHPATPPPDPAGIDFVIGANLVVSRELYEAIGPMREDYFLYYEEVDWVMRRGDLPLVYCENFRIYHRAGTAIGSPLVDRLASPLSIYFKHRSRMLFLRRFFPQNLPIGYAYSAAYVLRLLFSGDFAEAWALASGAFGLRPPARIRRQLGGAFKT
jgi:GT2 family glycosyltransferase